MDDNYKNTPTGRNTAQKYSDIIQLSRPEPSYKHPRMSLQNRAKIFSPFAALRGYDEEIALENLDHQKVSKFKLTDEDREKLGQMLGEIRKGQVVSVTYFVPSSDPTLIPSAWNDETAGDTNDTTREETTGFYHTLSATVGSVDLSYQKLRLYSGIRNEFGKELPVVIPFDDILNISIKPSATGSTD